MKRIIFIIILSMILASIVTSAVSFQSLKEHEGVSANSSIVAEGSAPLFWNFTSKKRFYAVCISPDNKYVVAGSDDRNVYCFDLATGQKVWNYNTGEWSRRVLVSIFSVSISPDNKYAIAGTASNVYCFNITSGARLWNHTTGEALDVFVSSDSKYVVVASENHYIYKLNITDGAEVWKYNAGHFAYRVSMSSDGQYVVAGLFPPYSIPYALIALNASGNFLWSYNAHSGVCSLFLSPDGKYVLAGTSGNYADPTDGHGRIFCLNITNGGHIWNYTATGSFQGGSDLPVTSVFVSSDSKFVTAGTGNGIVPFINISDGRLIWDYSTGHYSWAAYISPSNGFVVAGGNSGLYCLDGMTGNKMWNYTQPVTAISISPDDKHAVAGTWDGIYAFALAKIENLNTHLWYETISGAVDASETFNGHTIVVYSGVYHEHVNVAKSIFLLGTNRDTTIIDGDGTGSVIRITADDAKVQGFAVQNGGTTFPDSGILLDESKKCSVIDTIATNNKFGILLILSLENNVTNNFISNNIHGMELYEGSNKNILAGNNISKNNAGILLSESCYNVIKSNVISNNNFGIVIGGNSNNNIIDSNVVSGAGAVGIRAVDGSSGNIIANNAVLENLDALELTYANNNILLYNRASHNHRYGILIGYSNNSIVVGNEVSNNEYGIRVSEFSRNTTINHNNFMNNSHQVETLFSPLNTTWDDGAEGNHWSNYNGIDSNHDGIGDTPHIIDIDNKDNYPLMKPYIPGDCHYDGIVNIKDVTLVTLAWNTSKGTIGFNPHQDLNMDGAINMADVEIIRENWQKRA